MCVCRLFQMYAEREHCALPQGLGKETDNQSRVLLQISLGNSLSTSSFFPPLPSSPFSLWVLTHQQLYLGYKDKERLVPTLSISSNPLLFPFFVPLQTPREHLSSHLTCLLVFSGFVMTFWTNQRSLESQTNRK